MKSRVVLSRRRGTSTRELRRNTRVRSLGDASLSDARRGASPQRRVAPGAFMSNLGTMGVIAEIMLHLIYIAVVGAMYGRAADRAAD